MWKLDASGRMTHWRDFRKVLDSLPLEEAIARTAEFWSSAPFTPYYLDPANSENWPDPWTLLYENYYCDIAKCLGIIYTLALTKHREQLDAELRVYRDSTSGYEYNLAWFDRGKYIANLIDGEIVNNTQIDKKLVLKYCYKTEDLHLKDF